MLHLFTSMRMPSIPITFFNFIFKNCLYYFLLFTHHLLSLNPFYLPSPYSDDYNISSVFSSLFILFFVRFFCFYLLLIIPRLFSIFVLCILCTSYSQYIHYFSFFSLHFFLFFRFRSTVLLLFTLSPYFSRLYTIRKLPVLYLLSFIITTFHYYIRSLYNYYLPQNLLYIPIPSIFCLKPFLLHLS